MRAPLRFFLAAVISLGVEALLMEVVPRFLKPPREEVKEVIRLSLYKPEVRQTKVTVKREKGKKKVEKEVKSAPATPEPRVKSSESRKELPEKKVEEEKVKERKRGGLKPLQGNLPADYVEAVRQAIQENIFYPLEALEAGIEGPVMVQFSLGREGELLSCKPLFGQEILARATCMAIERSKFPPIPPSIKNNKLSFQLQVDYELSSVKLK
jgi:protein TonB